MQELSDEKSWTYPVALHYISLLTENLRTVEHIDTIRYKMSIAFVLHNLIDKKRLSKAENFPRPKSLNLQLKSLPTVHTEILHLILLWFAQGHSAEHQK